MWASTQGRVMWPILFMLALQVGALLPLPMLDAWETAPGGEPGSGPGALLWNSLHPPAYALLAWLWCISLQPVLSSGVRLVIAAFLMTVMFGTFVEWTQGLTAWRTASVEDGLLNVLGAVIGVMVFWIWRKRWHSSNT